jgi:hypothetical protein
MAVLQGGVSLEIAGVGAEAASGLHVIAKPQSYGTLGHYQFSGVTGAIAAAMAANGEVLQFRWTDATRLCLVQKIWVTGIRATTAFAAGTFDIKATIARSWTASGTGGTALTLTGENNQLRTNMGASLAGDVRIATTAALGAGTKTLDTQDIGNIATHTSGGTGSATPIIGALHLPMNDLFECDVTDGEHPIVLVQNEGVVVRATVPATGVWNIGIGIKWAEVAAF